MTPKQATIDLMVGVAIRKLGINCPPDVLIDLAVETAAIAERRKLREEELSGVFEECINAYLDDERMKYRGRGDVRT